MGRPPFGLMAVIEFHGITCEVDLTEQAHYLVVAAPGQRRLPFPRGLVGRRGRLKVDGEKLAGRWVLSSLSENRQRADFLRWIPRDQW